MIHFLTTCRFGKWWGCIPLLLVSFFISAQSGTRPEQVRIRYAKGFSVRYAGTYKIVHILSPFGKSTDTARYLLIPRGKPRPKGFAGYEVVETPVRSLVAMSSMHIGLLGFLGAEDVLTGLGNLKYVSSPKVIARIEAGKVKEVGKDQTLNEELVVAMHPDLVMAVGTPNARLDRYETLRRAGIPVLVNSEWVETTPLARAEWVKLVAVLLNRETLVNQQFAKVEAEYNRLAALTRAVKTRPSVITGTAYKDSWFVPNGDSYMARFFKDAGASYPWAHTRSTGSLPLNFETVFPVGLKADVWLNVGLTDADTKKGVLGKDPRYAEFKAFKSGRMYNYSKRTNSRGSNDYWESGAVSPHRVLADLIRILHPELLPTHELYYYQQVK